MKGNRVLFTVIIVVALLATVLLMRKTSEVVSVGAKEPIAGVKGMDLSEVEERQLLDQAGQGNTEAAVRLGKFYDFVKLNPGKAIFWFRKAAENADVYSQYNLGIRLIARQDDASRKEGIYWLEKAEKNGEPLAKSALEDLKKSPER